MALRELLVLMNGRLLGIVVQDGNKLELRYDDDWLAAPNAIPLSLSMPLSKQVHRDEAISAFMWGLLPDNEITLSEWGKRHHVSPRNCFALLGAVGEDAPGAVQFVLSERLDEIINAKSIDWLDQSEFEDLIVGLKANSGAGRRGANEGQFSLAGAQPKTALRRDGVRWGIPRGREPSTHILKPATGEFYGLPEIEHFCLRLADRLGLGVADSEVLLVRNTPVISVARYDRLPNEQGQIVRLHQEDMCQASGVPPTKKYQNEGGPGVDQIMQILQRHSSSSARDLDRFARALAFNFVILGTDAHAKNYSLMLLPSRIRLAPLYDLGSYLPYVGKTRGIKMAMKIGETYDADRMSPHDWEAGLKKYKLEGRLFSECALAHVRDIVARVPGEALQLLQTCRAAGLTAPVLDTLVDALWFRCRLLAKTYGTEVMSQA